MRATGLVERNSWLLAHGFAASLRVLVRAINDRRIHLDHEMSAASLRLLSRECLEAPEFALRERDALGQFLDANEHVTPKAPSLSTPIANPRLPIGYEEGGLRSAST